MRPSGLRSMARAAGAATALLASLAAGCSNGDSGGSGGSDPETGALDLFIVDMDQDGLDSVPLNQPVQIEFSEFVKPDTIRHDTIQVRQGPNFGIQSPGEYKVWGTSSPSTRASPPRATSPTEASGPGSSTA